MRGEAVVGLKPVLDAGGAPFVYCSCTHSRHSPGRMEGDFTFIEGTLAEPAGPPFEVVCATFALALPPFVF